MLAGFVLVLLPLLQSRSEARSIRTIDEHRLADDEQLVATVSSALQHRTMTVDALLTHLGQPGERDDGALGFGLRRLLVGERGGYTNALVHMLISDDDPQRSIAEMRVEISCQDADPRAVFARLARRLPAGARETQSRTIRIEWRDGELSQCVRRRVSDELGALSTPEIPDELRESLDRLTSPFEWLELGERCGIAGLPARGSMEAMHLLEAGRVDLLRIAVHGLNPEGRGWAAYCLRLHQRRSGEVARADAVAIERLLRLSPEVAMCDGCEGSRLPLGPALERLADMRRRTE